MRGVGLRSVVMGDGGVDIKAAARAALEWYREFDPEAARRALRIEEVWRGADGGWLVTLGYNADYKRVGTGGLRVFDRWARPELVAIPRVYKVLEVTPGGDVVGFRERVFEREVG